MSKEENITASEEKEGIDMNTANMDRYCTIEESISQSFKEIKLMHNGELPKKTWSEFIKQRNQEDAKEK